MKKLPHQPTLTITPKHCTTTMNYVSNVNVADFAFLNENFYCCYCTLQKIMHAVVS